MVFVWSNIENTEEQYELQVILIKLYYIFLVFFWDLFVHSELIWGRVWHTSCLIFSNWVMILWFCSTKQKKKQITFNVKIQTSIFELLFHCGWIGDIIIYLLPGSACKHIFWLVIPYIFRTFSWKQLNILRRRVNHF